MREKLGVGVVAWFHERKTRGGGCSVVSGVMREKLGVGVVAWCHERKTRGWGCSMVS